MTHSRNKGKRTIGIIDTCHVGDCRELLRDMAAAGVRVQTCVTSPPYYGLRDYGVHGQIGLEATPADYVTQLVEVFSAVRDVLADDGTIWLNLGDSYAGSGKGGNPDAGKQSTNKGSQSIEVLYGKVGAQQQQAAVTNVTRKTTEIGCKPKDLIGIPWRVAFALQADGWYLRSDIIWSKPNPMPESVTDRPTRSHEYLFLLSKSERYYYDSAAIAEPALYPNGSNSDVHKNAQPYWNAPNLPDRSRREFRNKRSVWTVSTRPYPQAHFAVFPTTLIEPCVLASSKRGDIVLDPFMGSGTTAQVAQHLGRHWIGCEVNPEYLEYQRQRLSQLSLGV